MKHNRSTVAGWPSFWHQGKQPHMWAKVLSNIYCSLVQLRCYCYTSKICKIQYAPKPVLVIGNRVVGGAGKTPTILGLVRLLQQQNIQVGIVSRGYGRKLKNLHHVQATDTTDQAGDEPLLLKHQLNVPVVVATNRVAAVNSIIQQYPQLDLIISDDGWQHLAMGRNAVIEVIDAEKGYGNGLCLPAGPLREPIDASKADLVLYQGKDMILAPTAWYHLASKTFHPLDEMLMQFQQSEAQITALAGIGNPDRFFTSLIQLGMSLSQQIPLADHQPIPLEYLANTQPNNHFVIMTMKDAMRCPDQISENCWALEVETQFTHEMQERLLNLSSQLINRIT